MSHALLSCERNDWQTPLWFLDLVRDVNDIALDPASSVANPTDARRHIVQDAERGVCGLRADWDVPADRGLVFVNPPYGAHLSGPIEPDYRIMRKNKLVGIGRGWGRRIAEHTGEAIALVPVRTETEWWRTLYAWADLVLLWSSPTHGCRISFVNPDTGRPQQGSNLASTVFYRAPIYGAIAGRGRFRDVFGRHGTLIEGGSAELEAA